jgi:hypothetical protein
MLILILIIFILLLSFINKDCVGIILLNDFIWINIIISLFIFNIIYYVLMSLEIENFSNINNDNKILSSIGICSKKCCPDYYKNDIDDDRIKEGDINNKYLTSSFSCNDGVRDRGCVCIKSKLSNDNKNLLETYK